MQLKPIKLWFRGLSMLEFLLEHNINNVVKPRAGRSGMERVQFRFPSLPASVFDKFEMRLRRRRMRRMEEWHFIPAPLLLTRSSESLARPLGNRAESFRENNAPSLQLSEGNQTNYM